MPVWLSPTPEQAAILRAHCQEYLSTLTVLVHALDSDVLPSGGEDASTKDLTAAPPSAVKHPSGPPRCSLRVEALVRVASHPGAAQAPLPVEHPDLATRRRYAAVPRLPERSPGTPVRSA